MAAAHLHAGRPAGARWPSPARTPAQPRDDARRAPPPRPRSAHDRARPAAAARRRTRVRRLRPEERRLRPSARELHGHEPRGASGAGRGRRAALGQPSPPVQQLLAARSTRCPRRASARRRPRGPPSASRSLAALQVARVDDLAVAALGDRAAPAPPSRRPGSAPRPRRRRRPRSSDVGLVEGAAELVPERLRARVAVRLEEHHRAPAAGARRAASRAWPGSRSGGGRSRRSPATPPASPRIWKRRSTPVKDGEALRGSRRTATPRSRPTATAASELSDVVGAGHGQRRSRPSGRRRCDAPCSVEPVGRSCTSRARDARPAARGRRSRRGARRAAGCPARGASSRHSTARAVERHLVRRSRRTPPARPRGRGRCRGARGRCW